jgi:hypothetical protein
MNRFFEEWMKELDELDVQVKLGAEEVGEAFEKQKNRLAEWADKARAELDSLDEQPWVLKLRGQIDELRVQAALGRAETRDALNEQRENLEKAMQRVGEEFKGQAEGADERASEWGKQAGQMMENLQARFDLLRLQLHLGQAEAAEEWEEKRKELSGQIEQLKARAVEGQHEAEEKWQEISGEISEAYTHMKNALRRMFS